jgi:predicted alpha/beta hydrolase family esterase
MKNAILLHGMPDKEEYYCADYPSASNSHWFPWLQKQLLIKGIPTVTPEMYKAYAPEYTIWKEEFEKHSVGAETILVGHSCGAGFLLRWLSEHPEVSVDTLVLVAPWMDPEKKYTTDFFEFSLDPQLFSRCKKFIIFVSSDDFKDVQTTVKNLQSIFPDVTVRNFENYGHFCFDDMGETFPELLEVLLG